MYISHFVYPLICQEAFGLLLPLYFVNNAAVNMGVEIFVNLISILLYIYPEMELLDHVVTL